ncbi:MAG TPA: DegT/DnrJ/EryC1/StrS family aminotransferase [Blastocatellia bacterium]|nr:DegT/DnrJ/EryC1/StrS family aminotransferase [Blastocatellia bacterium]
MIPFVDLKAQYQSIKTEVHEAINRVIEDCSFILGEAVESFEADFARFCQAEYALGTNSGTSAIHLALMAAGVKAGDEVITVSHTFVATVAAVRHAGATPVLVEVEPRAYNMDPARIEAAITPKTRVIMPVHLYGQCADMDPILEIARRHNLIVIEDAAQAHGAEYNGRRAGSMGDLACFSFYPGKNLGAYGEGGAVVTSNPDFHKLAKLLRDHGSSRKYHHELVGYNYRLEGIQGAILGVKLRYLDDWNAARREHAGLYRRLLSGAGVGLLEEMDYGRPIYHIFPVFTPRRDELIEHLKADGVQTNIHYPIPAHLQPANRDLGYKAGDLPVTERAANETLSLPMFAELTDEQIEAVVKSINRFEKRAADVQA